MKFLKLIVRKCNIYTIECTKYDNLSNLLLHALRDARYLKNIWKFSIVEN